MCGAHVDASELLPRTNSHLSALPGSAYIGRHGEDPPARVSAEFLGHLFKPVPAPGDQDEIGAGQHDDLGVEPECPQWIHGCCSSVVLAGVWLESALTGHAMVRTMLLSER
jgi:hypothetical protein